MSRGDAAATLESGTATPKPDTKCTTKVSNGSVVTTANPAAHAAKRCAAVTRGARRSERNRPSATTAPCHIAAKATGEAAWASSANAAGNPPWLSPKTHETAAVMACSCITLPDLPLRDPSYGLRDPRLQVLAHP